MGKLRIYDLAKKLNLESKDLISRLNDLGIFVKTASSSVEEDEFNRVKARLEGKVEEAVAEKKTRPTIINSVSSSAPRIPLLKTFLSTTSVIVSNIMAKRTAAANRFMRFVRVSTHFISVYS